MTRILLIVLVRAFSPTALFAQTSRGNAMKMNSILKLAFLLISFGLLLVSCSDGDKPTDTGTGGVINSVVFERPDGSKVQFGTDIQIWCGAWEEGLVPNQTLHIMVGAQTSGDGALKYWWLRAVVDDVTIGEEMTFPNSFIWDEPKDVDIFVFDSPNELSTQDERSSGSIVFQQLQCHLGGDVEFTIEAVIGSEFGDGPPLQVEGSFQGKVTLEPRPK